MVLGVTVGYRGCNQVAVLHIPTLFSPPHSLTQESSKVATGAGQMDAQGLASCHDQHRKSQSHQDQQAQSDMVISLCSLQGNRNRD
jgi:hypothetical protein